jgi:hypothetical protein
VSHPHRYLVVIWPREGNRIERQVWAARKIDAEVQARVEVLRTRSIACSEAVELPR